MSTKVAVLGGGNGGHAASVDLTLRGCEVHMYEDARFASKMKSVFDTKTIQYKGALGEGSVQIAMVTSDMAEAVRDVEFVVVAVPAFAHAIYAKELAKVVHEGQTVLVIPGTFGSLAFWKEFKAAGLSDVPVAETNTLPYATRLTGEGSVTVMSRFALKLGVMPASRTGEVAEKLSALYDSLETVESVIACGLSSLNPIIHVPGCILNAGYIEYSGEPFHYYVEGFSDCVARATEAVDNERCAILQKLGYKHDIVAHGIGGAVKTDSIKEAIAGDPSFSRICIPPTFQYRYYTEDIPYGLAAWAKLAKQFGVDTPIMDAMITLGGNIMEKDCWSDGRSLEELGIAGMDSESLKEYLTNG